MYSSYKRYRSYAGKRYGARSSRYTSTAARSNRIIRASQAGTKKISVVIPRTFDGNFVFAANSNISGVLSVKANTGTDPSTLAWSKAYQAYAALYDECKIVGCKTSWAFGSAMTTGSSTYMTLYSAVDRMHYYMQTSTADSTPMTAQDIANSSSCIKTNFTVQQRLAATRNMYARNFLEKNTWWDSTVWIASDNSQMMIPGLRDNAVAYNPIMYLFVSSQTAPAVETNLPFRVETTWILEFRNPKASFASSSSKALIADIPIDTRALFNNDPEKKAEDEEEKEQPAMAAADEGTS